MPMMPRSRICSVLLWTALCLYPVPALATTISELRGTDPVSNYAQASPTDPYVFSTGTLPASDATVLAPPELVGLGTLHIELTLDGAETANSLGTVFTGTDDGSPDWYVCCDGGSSYLEGDIDYILLTNFTFNGSFTQITTLTFGGTDLGLGQARITLTGGTLASSYGGVGAEGTLELFLTNLTGSFGVGNLGSLFDAPFTSQTNINSLTLIHMPEPGTLTLLSGALVGIAAWRRRARLRS